MQKITADGLVIHNINDPTCRYFVYVPIKGLGELPQRVSSFNRAGQDGTYIANIFQGQRVIHMEGRIVAQNGDNFPTLRQNLANLQQPRRNSNGVLQKKTFSFVNDSGFTYAITGQVNNVLLPEEYLRTSAFQVEVLGDSYFYDSLNQQSLTLTISSGGGFVLPVIVPIVFAAGTGNTGTASNSGNVTSYPIITITGISTNPLLVNQTTGAFISFALTVGASDTLIIDMLNKVATINGNSAMQYINSGSTWWGIGSGNNTISLTSGGGGDNGQAVLTWYNTFTGI